MTDPVSVTFGVLGLAGLVSTIGQVWGLVDAGRSYSDDLVYLRTRLDNQRAIFVRWGQNMNFGSVHGYDARLDDPSLRPRLEATLRRMERLFSDTDKLTDVYGIETDEKEGNTVIRVADTRSVLKQLRGKFGTGNKTFRRNRTRGSVFQITKWSVKDGSKFKLLVERISELMSDLDQLTRHVEVQVASTVSPSTMTDAEKQLETQQGDSPHIGYVAEELIEDAEASDVVPVELEFQYPQPTAYRI